MINVQTKLSIKDNSLIKKIQCISPLNKKKIKITHQFKGVILESKCDQNQKGKLINAMLCSSAFNSNQFSGKVKKFQSSDSILIKNLSGKKIELIGTRVLGIQCYNLKYFFEKNSAIFNLCK